MYRTIKSNLLCELMVVKTLEIEEGFDKKERFDFDILYTNYGNDYVC